MLFSLFLKRVVFTLLKLILIVSIIIYGLLSSSAISLIVKFSYRIMTGINKNYKVPEFDIPSSYDILSTAQAEILSSFLVVHNKIIGLDYFYNILKIK